MVAQTLTLDSCKALAMRNNVEVKNAALNVEAAREVKKQAFTKYFPNVSVMAGGYYAAKPLFEYGIDDIENANARQWLHNLYYEYGAAIGLPDRITLCENGVMAGATVVQPVYMGGQIVNGNRLADVGVAASEYQSQLTNDQVQQQVEKAKASAAAAAAEQGAPRVLFVRTAASGIHVKGSEGTVLGLMLRDLCCVNVADGSELLENLSLEKIIEEDPDMIFIVVQGSDKEGAQKTLEDNLLSNLAWSGLTAVKEGQVHYMEKSLYHLKPNDRWGIAYEQLEKLLYGE